MSNKMMNCTSYCIGKGAEFSLFCFDPIPEINCYTFPSHRWFYMGADSVVRTDAGFYCVVWEEESVAFECTLVLECLDAGIPNCCFRPAHIFTHCS